MCQSDEAVPRVAMVTVSASDSLYGEHKKNVWEIMNVPNLY